jgi:general nucleoside transport system ATP-binding protein
MTESDSQPQDHSTPVVEMRGIVKTFPGVLANDHVDFEARRGEIHTLLGENGAGKSTLMSILGGLYSADEGEIIVHGKAVELRSPRDAIDRGIGVVYQNFMLVDMQTVAENVILGMREPRMMLNYASIEREIAEFGKKYGMQVDPKAFIYQLSVGEQQRVEILKMLYRGADILILDEPTAVLVPQEVEEFFITLRKMAAAGKTIILISHKLDEVMSISDRITVLRAGRLVGTMKPCDTCREDLARMMVGREVIFHTEKPPHEPGGPVLELRNLWAESDKGLPALKGVSLTVRAGEIVGVAGVAGNGQRELAEVIAGLRKVKSGRVLVQGQDSTNNHPRRMIERKVSHIPEDRVGEGLITTLSVSDNLILKEYRGRTLAHGPFINASAVRQFASRLVADYGVNTPSLGTPMGSLSGGNLQKAVLAREISIGPEVIVAVHPTRGLDVGATETVHRILLEQRMKGTAVLLISEDLDEIMEVADRIVVLYEGEIQGDLPASQADCGQLGLMMTGAMKQRPSLERSGEEAQ